MRVLIAGTTYFPALNGQSVFMVHLAEGLAAHGHDVSVLCPGERDESRRLNGVAVEVVRSLELKAVRAEAYFPYAFGRRVAAVFDAFKPEIVHIHDHYPLCVAVVQAARQRGIRAIGTNHFVPANVEPYIPAARLVRPVLDRILWYWMFRLYGHLDFVTAPSEAAVSLLQQNGLRVPMRAVSCGTDLERFHPDPTVDRLACRRTYGLEPAAKLFLYVGRNDREKRIEVLLRAMQRLGRPDVQLAIAGEGAAQPQLKQLANELKLGDRARFLGRVPNEDLNPLLNSADAFALASEAELLSIASLEAMASGRPLLLANAGALPELVAPGVNGFTFRPGDPDDAAHYMALLADQPALREKMGRLSRERVTKHSMELTLQTYAQIYGQVLESAPVRARAGRVESESRPSTKPFGGRPASLNQSKRLKHQPRSHGSGGTS